MRNEISNELSKVLDIFEEAYIQRDVNKIDAFMEFLFDKDESIVVIGTSGGEWCMGYEEARELFLNDWKYWCDLRFNSENSVILPLENTGLIYVPATIKYTFRSNSDTYSRFLGYVREYFDGTSFDSKKPDKVKLTEINWTLCHLLNQWDGDERHYLWDLRISFVLAKKAARWVVRQMQFSLPVVGYLPDERLDNTSYDVESFKSETRKMENYCSKNIAEYREEISKLLQNFNRDYLNKDFATAEVVKNYFALNSPLIINTDNTVCNTQKDVEEMIKKHRSCYDEIELDSENCLVNSNEEVVWLVTHGTMKKVIQEKEGYEKAIENIKSVFSSNLTDKDKLFRIRRGIADTLKENSRGEEYIWPFRFEAMLIRERYKWVFKYLQFSLPFNYILEGKTEAASVLEKE
jgi:hypothetical protein